MMSETLQPYDGANRVQLPNGTVCWEKETEHFGCSETTLSYQYSVELPKDMLLDYWGRVVGIKVQSRLGCWNEPVNFMPVTDDLIDNVRRVIEAGWIHNSSVLEIGHGGWEERVLQSEGYLKITGDVMALLKAMKR